MLCTLFSISKYSRNHGLKKATGRYIGMFDSDDILLPDRIEKQWNYMENNPNIDVLGVNVQYFKSSNNKNLNTSKFPAKNILKSYRKGENGVLQPTIIIKTDLYKRYNYIEMVPGQDYQLFARMIIEGAQFANIPDIVNRMHIHPQNAVSNITYASLSKIFECRDQLFGKRTHKLTKERYYRYLKTYRKAMLSDNIVEKYTS